MSRDTNNKHPAILDRLIISTYKRNHRMERFIRMYSRVELYLRNTLGTNRIFEWLKGKYISGFFRCKSGEIEIELFQTFDAIHAVPDVAPLLIDPQHYCEPPLWHTPTDAIAFPYLLNGRRGFLTPFLMLRLYSVAQPIPDIMLEELQYLDLPWNPTEERLSLYDHVSAYYLADKFGISDGLMDEKSYGEQWRRCYADMSAGYDSHAELIAFRGVTGATSFNLELLSLGEEALLTPVSFYQYPIHQQLLRLYIPPQPPFCLYNAFKIAETPGATVIFTDDLATAISNDSDLEVVFCSFYGGDEAIPHLDLSPLAKRHVIWLLLGNPSHESAGDKYVAALKIAKHLAPHNVNLDFAIFSNLTWEPSIGSPDRLSGRCDSVKLIDQSELIREATQQGIYIPEELHVPIIKNIEGSVLEKMKREPFLISPIIRRGSGTVIFGATGAAKSWLAMSIGVAAAHGKNVFSDRWQVMKPNGVKCLTIAGEMGSGEYGERLERLHQCYCTDEAHKNNFILHQADQLDIASREGFDQLHNIIDDAVKHRGVLGQPVELVILDNLTTLSIEGENPANFGRIEYALKALKSHGISVVMIHHENLKGDIRGARKISDVMDMKLHLFMANEGDKIGIVIKNEKIRSGKQSEFATFKAMFDVESKGTGWVVSALTESELAAIGGGDDEPVVAKEKTPKTKRGLKAWEWMNDDEKIISIKEQRFQGLTNDQIAANHITSTSTISAFRMEKLIRDCDLRSQLFGGDGGKDEPDQIA